MRAHDTGRAGRAASRTGEPEELLKLKAEKSGELVFEAAGVNASTAPVLCMWCAFADQPEILGVLPSREDD
jgi:hypothetical protein